MSLGSKIKQARKEAKLTQEELAIKAGISRMSVRRYESDERIPNIEAIKNIATVLDLSPSQLLGEDFQKSFIRDLNKESLSPALKTIESLEIKLNPLDHSIGEQLEEGYLWINYPDGALEVTLDELQDLDKELESFTLFKLQELKEKKKSDFRPKNI